MQIEIEIGGLATLSTEPRKLKFSGFGLGLRNTLELIASGIQTKSLVTVFADDVCIHNGTGRSFCDWVSSMSVKGI